jgi:tetratricopeptide (TPR) repeat protein
MKTITFYSYKGGVGRSLTLANMANRLAEFGKSVCLLDFDLEAPGLHLKFESEIKMPITKGLVDYVYSYAKEGILPDSILPFTTRLQLYNNNNVHLIPAGAIHSDEYWKQLSSIDWYNLVYENPNSISFFLDLKQKIKKEIKPDFLLIDSRTGISEMSGITISLLADEVIIVSANNRENLMGSKKIIDFLQNREKSIMGKVPKVSFVLSRIPYSETPEQKGKEQQLIVRIKDEMSIVSPDNFFILHSDRELEIKEEIRIGNEIDENLHADSGYIPHITKEYLLLFEHITAGLLTTEENTRFENIKKSERIFKEALRTNNVGKKIELLKSAIDFNPQKFYTQFILANTFFEVENAEEGFRMYDNLLKAIPEIPISIYDYIGKKYAKFGKFNEANSVFNKILSLFPNESHFAYFGLGYVSDLSGRYEDAIEYYEKALFRNPDKYSTYNNKANTHRILGNLEDALQDVFKALEINSEKTIAYLTLSEIYATQGKLNEFYIYFEIALSKSPEEVAELLPKEKIYSRFLKEERFIKLLEKYDVPIPSYE